ncbi:ATP-binding protein [Telmatospirillum sp. J64-1]|uniref:ATP-binding protein n=1 Tax=Telmatospirillum sp. J64-1 TaxID=2502183 RepID=UPI00115EF8BD|nr:ATP-binding protein [Telmatospirillum sp. J64-1]
MTQPDSFPAVDLSNCAREPIRIPGSIQPHGVLLAFGAADGRLRQVSANLADVFGITPEEALGKPVGQLLENTPLSSQIEDLRQVRAGPPKKFPKLSLPSGKSYQLLAHRSGEVVVVELEECPPAATPSPDIHALLQDSLDRLRAASAEELDAVAAQEVRRITGFDRVLIYRFDEEWNGMVIAEDRNEHLPSYLDLRFPASDIPEQARELYRINRLRLIPDAAYQPVPLVPPLDPETGKALDLSFSVLRSVSPIHLEYMRNMGIPASMSFSVIQGERLWGLISCHNHVPAVVPFGIRTACDLFSQVYAVQIESRERSADAHRRLKLKQCEARLLAAMAGRENYLAALAEQGRDFLALADAQGAAIIADDQLHLVGRTPKEEIVRDLAQWLREQGKEEVFATDRLADLWPQAKDIADSASGVLAVSISSLHPSFVIWFRPEVVQTVKWGGDPRKPVEPEAKTLHPRKSFEMWKEVVHLRSRPWQPSEIDAARDLRQSIVGIVLRQAEELAELSKELERSNKELASFSYSVSHDLRAPFRHIVGYSELLRDMEKEHFSPAGQRYLDIIIESALSAGELVDSLLHFAQMGRATLNRRQVDMNTLLCEVIAGLESETAGRQIVWRIADLPPVEGDAVMLRMVLQNLVSNALKYSRQRHPAVIEIGAEKKEPGMITYFVRDNGIGFDMAYVDKLFGVFQRLHRAEEYEGIGIGLANVRRVAERHGGRAWAEGEPGKGASFYVSLPVTEP